MTYRLTVSPDFSPSYIAGWYIFNTWLQTQINEAIHLELYNSFASQRKDIADDKIDIIYANPYDASTLIREKGFVAVAAPANRSDEVVVCVQSDSAVKVIEDLKENCNVAMAEDPEINTLGMIMLEPADLDAQNINILTHANYVMVAKNLINGSAEAGFFLKEAYEDMSKFIKTQIRPIAVSQISVIKHIFLVGPGLTNHIEEIRGLLKDMHKNEKGRDVLKSLCFTELEDQTHEDSEFMIDLMDTLI